MSPVRTWKDLDYRDSLTRAELAELAHPAGSTISDDVLAQLTGGSIWTPSSPVCGTVVALTFTKCTVKTICGTCGVMSQGCC